MKDFGARQTARCQHCDEIIYQFQTGPDAYGWWHRDMRSTSPDRPWEKSCPTTRAFAEPATERR